MIPAHFYSLWHILRKYNIVQNSFNEIQIKNIDLGQYKGYKEEINLPNSKTETYFKINGKVDGIDIVFESGKNFGEKLTEITIVFGNGDSMKWNIDPRKTLNINDTLEIDLNRNNNLDHTNLLEDIKSNFTERFLKEEDALNGWLFYSKIYEFVKNNNIPLKIY
jgi:hypothetical protein